MNHKIVLTFVAFITIQSLCMTFGAFAQDQTENENAPNDEVNVSMDMTSILPLVTMIKGQIREIVMDLAMQVFQFIRAIVQDIKVRLLKRIGKYTLADCFHLIFDGVIELVKDETSESAVNEATAENSKITTKTSTTIEESNNNMNDYDDEYTRRRRAQNINPYTWN